MRTRSSSTHLALTVSAVYLLAGVLWILISDNLLEAMTADAAFLTRMQKFKGWFFIGCTASGLFAGLRWVLRGWEREAREREEAEKDLRRMHGRLERLVGERTAQIEAKNKELEAFTYSVSHDLKAPLRGIDGYSQLLEEDYAAKLGEEGRRFIRTIRQAAGQMNQLIDDLLSYSRMERRSMNVVATRLPRVAGQVLAGFESDPRRARAEIRVELPETALKTDAESLAMALRNLVDNALKFSSGASPPVIEIRAESSLEDCCHLVVRDNGPGFDMKYHDRIFEIFQRLHRVEDYPGTGIGLALVRKAMERLGGRAWAESRPGQGAAFHLEFPTTLT